MTNNFANSTSAPLVSVIMPVYNAEAYLRDSIQSILQQTFGDFEFIIIDDGSTDRSFDIIASFTDPRIRYFRNAENRGLVYTLNRCIEEAHGKFLARMDADDVSRPERLARQVQYMEDNPNIDVLGTWFELSSGVIIRHPIEHQAIKDSMLFTHCAIGHPTVCIRKSILIKYSDGYSRKFSHAEDYGLWAKILPVCTFHNLPEVLLWYRIHTSQVSSKHAIVQVRSSNKAKLLLLHSSLPARTWNQLIGWRRLIVGHYRPGLSSLLSLHMYGLQAVIGNFLVPRFSRMLFFRYVFRHLLRALYLFVKAGKKSESAHQN